MRGLVCRIISNHLYASEAWPTRKRSSSTYQIEAMKKKRGLCVSVAKDDSVSAIHDTMPRFARLHVAHGALSAMTDFTETILCDVEILINNASTRNGSSDILVQQVIIIELAPKTRYAPRSVAPRSLSGCPHLYSRCGPNQLFVRDHWCTLTSI